MTWITRRTFLQGTALSAAMVPLSASNQASAATPGSTDDLSSSRPNVTRVTLRGYGTLTTTFTSTQDQSASQLSIQCEDSPKALLVQAKYLSDLTRLPAVTPGTLTAGSLQLPVYRTTTGVVAAYARSNLVLLLAASSDQALQKAIQQWVPAGATVANFQPGTTVPLYLNYFDQCGLMIKYGDDEAKGKPVSAQFQFMQQAGTGPERSLDAELINNAEGLDHPASFSWVVREAERYKLPFTIATDSFGADQWQFPLWFTNRYSDQVMQKMPQYSGTWNPGAIDSLLGSPQLSFCSTTGQDAWLGQRQAAIRQYADHPNLIGWQEPHAEEMGPPTTLLCDYGPVADQSFRTFLRERYPGLDALSTAWYGSGTRLRSWNDVKVPEVASFLGWGPQAFDLTGSWTVLYSIPDKIPNWYQPDFVPDNTWGTLPLPGNDRHAFTSRGAMLARRTVTIPSSWLSAGKRVWLYVWDLNTFGQNDMPAYVNGLQHNIPASSYFHSGWVEVTSALRPGENLFAFFLAQGRINYRCYLSGDAPLQYPGLGPQANARWRDFRDWDRWLRAQAVQRGVEMIRQVDPNRPIKLLSPRDCADLLMPMFADFGCMGQDTGISSVIFRDDIPLYFSGSGRPATAEPGGAASTGPAFMAYWGHWITAAYNQIKYMHNLSLLQDNPEVLAVFQQNRVLYESIGKYHVPEAEVAILYGLRSWSLAGGSWPWTPDPSMLLIGGYYQNNTGFALLNVCPRDGLTERDFAPGGKANNYRVIVDSNTTIMDEDLVAQIEQWVRRGGTFITFVQTGRHTSTQANAWPIERLTGYHVTAIDNYSVQQTNPPTYTPTTPGRGLKAAAGQKVFTNTAWLGSVKGNGLSLRRVAPEAQDLLLWADTGAVAVGLRPLGRGRVIHLGCHFEMINDRYPCPNEITFLSQITDYLQVERVPAQVQYVEPVPKNPSIVFRHFISNCGLQDIWVLFNDSNAPDSVKVNLVFTSPHPPETLIDLLTGAKVPVTKVGGASGVWNITFSQAYQMIIYVSPRGDIPQSSLEWLTLQSKWWAGTARPRPYQLPSPSLSQHNTIDFTADWAFKPTDGLTSQQILALVQSNVDDSSWPRRPLGIWSADPGLKQDKSAVLRRMVTVPVPDTHTKGTQRDWTLGEIELWMDTFWGLQTFKDQGQVYIDGHAIQNVSPRGPIGLVTPLLTPGQHLIAITVQASANPAQTYHPDLVGVLTSAWLYHVPPPAATQDLSGTWTQTSSDGLHDAGTINLPATPLTGKFASRQVVIDPVHARQRVLVHIQRTGDPTVDGVAGVIINGRYIGGDFYQRGSNLVIDITQLVTFGPAQPNTLDIVVQGAAPGHPVSIPIAAVELRFYEPGGVYP